MTKYVSDKLTVLYTMLIIMVVYIHSYYPQGEDYPIADFLQKFTGNGICAVANCLFFAISGYLFARNVSDSNSVVRKSLKRIKSLLPPYLIWNVLFVLVYVFLDLIPCVSRFNNNGGILGQLSHQPLTDSLYYLFVEPAAFQLWFIRDLLVMFLATPILCYIAKNKWRLALVVALASTLVYGWLVYFWIGIILGVRRCDIESYCRDSWIVIVSGLVYFGYAIYNSLWGGYLQPPLLALINLMSVYFVWAAYDLLAKCKIISKSGIWKYICGYSFFIYCFHEPVLNIFKKLALALCGTNQLTIIVFYYLNPILMIITAVIAARLLKEFTPRIYAILTGGR